MTGSLGNTNQDGQNQPGQARPGRERRTYRLGDGDSPPPGYVLPPSAPLPPGQSSANGTEINSVSQSAATHSGSGRAYLDRPLPAHVQWPAILLPSSKPFRHYNQDNGQIDTVTTNARVTRQRTPTVRERVYPSSTAGSVPEDALANTGTVRMEKSDNVDSLEPLPQVAPPSTVPATKRPRTQEVEKDELVGTTYLGKYELVSVLGAGGMGVIYKAHQVFLERDYAIKMLKNKFASDKAKLRFHQEAKAASAINYPGIVGINDFGIDDQGCPYMVMEYVEGMTLSDLQKQRPQSILPVAEALPIFIEMLEALAVAHSKGVVHRDIKPSNIMLALRPDNSAHVKLLDFGIAKVRDFEDRTMQDLTRTGEALGTPLYMSPEQINSTRVDARTDLYSCGCVMYVCLTGCPPFVGANKMATMEKHLTEKPLPLKEASLGLDFAPELEALVIKLLSKKPEDRYQSADQVRLELLKIAAQYGVLKLPPQTVSVEQALKENAALSPAMPDEISQLVTEFTSLELSTACYTDNYPEDVKQKIFDAALAPTEFDRQSFVPSRPSDVMRSGSAVPLSESMPAHETGLARLERPGETVLEHTGRSQFGTSKFNDKSVVREQVLDASYVERPRRTVNQTTIIIALSLALVGAFAFAGYQMFKPVPKVQSVAPLAVAPVVTAPVKPVSALDISDDEITLNRVNADLRQVKFIADPEMTDVGLKYIARLKDLRYLVLDDTKVTDKGLASVADLPLEILQLSNTKITNTGLQQIGRMHIMVNLTLTGCRAVDNKGVAALSKLRYLRGLDLSGTNINSGCARDLVKLKMLTSLVLHGTDFDDDGLKQLSSLKELYQIDLSRTKVTSAGIRYLSNLPALYKLSLAYDQIDDSVLPHLLALKSLRHLELSGTHISDRAFVALAKMPQLEQLTIANCDVSAETAKSVSDLRPALRVNRNPQAQTFSAKD